MEAATSSGFRNIRYNPTFLECIKTSNLKLVFLNFTFLRQTKIYNIGATLVGVDKFGNKYYERLEDTQFGIPLFYFQISGTTRHRWVEYGDKGRYNASQVPPEWHGWLHFITDHTGDEMSVEHRENFSGESDEYIYPGQKD
ncbi:hypothetical protein AMTRI_Chr03g145140 [Amborella trichopoda]